MTKLHLLLIPFATLALPAAALAAEPGENSFDHEGSHYVYTVTDNGNYKTIRGIEEKSGKRFTLRVGATHVKGVVGTTPVRFRLNQVDRTTAEIPLAAR